MALAEFFYKKILLIFIVVLIPIASIAQNQKPSPGKKKGVSLNPYNFTVKDTINYVFFPNTTVKFKPPLHFISYDKINGFMHPGSSSTIQAQEINGTPYVMYVKALTPEYFEKQGVKLISAEEMKTRDNKPGMLYIVSFNVKGVDYERMMYFTGDYNKTVWISANYPLVVKFLLFDALKQSIITVQF